MKKSIAIGLFLASSASASLNNGNVGNFIGDSQFSTNVFELNNRAGTSGAPKNQPWSGTFWPLRSGSTANPYAERLGFGLNQLYGVKSNIRKFERRMNKLRAMLRDGKLDAATIRDMAPAEKYDLYLGDHDFSYTMAEWQSVSEQFNYIGQISLWEGTCHGWATAAIYEARPAHAISVISLDGKYVIPFFPHDLKALATRLWGNSLIQDHTLAQGFRCNSKHPKTDPHSGKVLDITCEGVNPGDFHITMLEMVGGRKESFVLNRKNTDQVWNQPVAGYELTYFNPATDKNGTLDQSIVRRQGFQDPYVKFRDASVTYVVGVEMKLKYISETAPNHEVADGPANDKVKTLKLRYDIELDADYKIVGGEWRHQIDPVVSSDGNSGGYNDETANMPQYPGFLWRFKDSNPVALATVDFDLSSSNLAELSREELVAASKKGSQFRYKHFNYDAEGNPTTIRREELRPQPLGTIVNALIEMAK